jgi:3-oxoacyl-[acyl-carrier-protein] synthase II
MTPLALTGFTVMKALSRNNDNPTEASRPFDLHRDGFVLSEGAGILVLEEMEHAKARGARIYAEFLGYGSTCDAHHLTAPGGGGAERCMALALRSAGLKPEDVDYVNAHGTSTLTNDANETRAIRTLFGAHANRLMVSSTKSVTGHLLGAAGGVEAMATAMALHTGLVPPTATWKTRDPDCDLDVVPGEARAHRVRAALSNSFGFGGTNASIVLGRFED